jgi:hypothetical protein
VPAKASAAVVDVAVGHGSIVKLVQPRQVVPAAALLSAWLQSTQLLVLALDFGPGGTTVIYAIPANAGRLVNGQEQIPFVATGYWASIGSGYKNVQPYSVEWDGYITR